MKFIFILLIFLTILNSHEKPINILLFNSYDQTFPWSKQFLEGIEEFQKNSSKKIEVYIETIDYVRLKDEIKAEDWEDHLRKKYKSLKFDGIIIDTISASEIFHDFSDHLYPTIPKIYISYLNVEKDKNAINMDSPRIEIVKQSIQLVKQNNKNLENIYVISPDIMGKELEKVLLAELKKESFNLVLLKNSTIEELKEELCKLPENSAVFYIINFKDQLKKSFIPRDFLEEISACSNMPIYSFWSTYMGAGTIGGYQYNGKTIAIQSLNSIINKIEKGEFLSTTYGHKLYLDYNVLKKFNLHENKYPDDAIIINKPIPVWKSYPKETIFALSTIILLSLVLILIIILKRKKEKFLKIEESMFIQSKQAALGEMINVIAHQWRQPLNNISVMIQTILLKHKRGKINDLIMDNFKTDIFKQIHYMLNTINDFKNFYNPNRQKYNFDVKEELLKTIELINSYYIKENIKIKINNISTFNILGYPNELSHCFLIILQNANEALLESTKEEKIIEITSQLDERNYKIIIENNGKQIPNNILENIYNPYFSTKNEKNNGGIGLYIAKTILEKHFNASINASNTSNGVKFEIIFKGCELDKK